ncbi:MAG: methyl-accepting chemotaxis protein [Bdellovibrionales bacterium]
MSYLENLSISTKNGLFGVVFSFVFGIAVICTIEVILDAYLLDRAQEEITTNETISRTIVEAKYGTDYKLKNGDLYVGDHNLDMDHTLVNEMTALHGGGGAVMTIFKGDIRVLTNVIDPKTGKYAIGTKLADGPAYESVFRNKKKYNGIAMIFGEPYLSSYDPILDKSGNVIGSYFVGINKNTMLAIINKLEPIIASVIAFISIFMAGGAWTISHYRLKPIFEMQKITERLRKGDADVTVPCLERGDEIGIVAQAIQTMKEYVIDNKRLQKERTQAVEAYTNRAEEIIRLQDEKQREMEVNAKRAEQLIDMQAERVSELAQKERRAKQMFELNSEFDKSVRSSIDSLLGAQNTLNTMAESMSHNVADASHIVQSASTSIKNVLTGILSIASATEDLAAASGEISRQVSQFSKLATNVVSALEAVPFAAVLKITNPINEMAAISISLVDKVDEQKNVTAKISHNAGGIAKEAEIIFDGVSSAENMVEMAKTSSKNVLNAANCLGTQSYALNKTVKEYLQKISSI